MPAKIDLESDSIFVRVENGHGGESFGGTRVESTKDGHLVVLAGPKSATKFGLWLCRVIGETPIRLDPLAQDEQFHNVVSSLAGERSRMEKPLCIRFSWDEVPGRSYLIDRFENNYFTALRLASRQVAEDALLLTIPGIDLSPAEHRSSRLESVLKCLGLDDKNTLEDILNKLPHEKLLGSYSPRETVEQMILCLRASSSQKVS